MIDHSTGTTGVTSVPSASMNFKHAITEIPTRKAKSFKNLNCAIENSSTITSEHAIYRNDPAAMHENMISVSSLDSCRAHPKATPTGVKSEKATKS